MGYEEARLKAAERVRSAIRLIDAMPSTDAMRLAELEDAEAMLTEASAFLRTCSMEIKERVSIPHDGASVAADVATWEPPS